jgi:hypothetical protein
MNITIGTAAVAKVSGWLQFILTTVSTVIASGGVPKGVAGWLALLASAFLGVGIHAATVAPLANTPAVAVASNIPKIV